MKAAVEVEFPEAGRWGGSEEHNLAFWIIVKFGGSGFQSSPRHSSHVVCRGHPTAEAGQDPENQNTCH